MKLKNSLLIIIFGLLNYGYAQVSTPRDSNRLFIEAGDIVYGCLDSNRIDNYSFISDSVLVDFFQRIEENGNSYRWCGDSINILLKILKRAEYNTIEACLLPFLSIIDSDAREIYKTNCVVSSRVHRDVFYCAEESVQFLLLFYVHFGMVNPLKLKEGEVLSSIELVRKNSDGESKLSQADYSELYSKYITWLSNTNLNRRTKKNPLVSSNYSWEVKIQRVSDPR